MTMNDRQSCKSFQVGFLLPPCVADADITFMVALWNRADDYRIFLPCGFFYFLFSSPYLSRRRLDVYHTSTHGVALVRI